VSKEEALQYLKLRKIDKEQAARIYELVGGRLIHLKSMANKIEKARLKVCVQYAIQKTGLASYRL
jgi:hypothetical protein